jgi:hypothetical protein
VEIGDNTTFSDVGHDHPFLEAIEWAGQNDVASGYADGTFRPANAVTRQAAVTFIYNYDQLPT